jgi:hypothetical protein
MMGMGIAAIVEHKYYAQVNKDIERSMFHFDVTKSYDKAMRLVTSSILFLLIAQACHVGVMMWWSRRRSRESLARIIHTMFTVHTDLHYIQGWSLVLLLRETIIHERYRLS